MGTTFCSIHICSEEPVTMASLRFQCFSKGWQTLLMEEDWLDPEDTQKIARKISKTVDAPVMWFFEFDEDFLSIKFYQNGKQAASYCGEELGTNKNLFKIPQMIGYGDGCKRRLAKILACSDVELQVDLLEEFFGLCLLPFPEMLEEDPQALVRMRDDQLYAAYIAEEKAMTGKRAPIQAELVQELVGWLDNADWHSEWFDAKKYRYLPLFQPHYFLYFDRRVTGVVGVPVHFTGGNIQFISAEEMRQNGAYKPDFGRKVGESPYYTTEFDPIRLIFADTAPAAYHGKEIPLPRGWYGLGISAQERMVLYDDKSTIAIADASMKIIAKQHLKGRIEDIDGDYVLTLELTGISGIIRVYRIVEK